MIVFDARVLIAYLDANDNLHDAAETLLAAAIDDDFGANSLTLAEALVVPARTGQIEAVQSALREIDIDELQFPSDTAVRLARLRAAAGLKMPDCCVLLSAEHHRASIASFDDRLAEAAEDRNLAVLRR